MPLLTQSISADYLRAYDGYDAQKVGMGMLEPNIYATKDYQKKKIQTLAIRLISEISYGGAETDRSPTIIPMAFEPSYNTVIGYNLNYATPQLRKAMLKFILDSNYARIKSNLPIIVDYYALKRAIPDTQYLVRRYKIVGISVLDTPPLMEWANIAKERTRYDGYYLQFKNKQ